MNKYLRLLEEAQTAEEANTLTATMNRARDANIAAHAAQERRDHRQAKKYFRDKEFYCINLLLLPGSTLECEGTLYRVSNKGNELDGGVHMIAQRFGKIVMAHPKLEEGQRKQLMAKAESAHQTWLAKKKHKKEAAERRRAKKKVAKSPR